MCVHKRTYTPKNSKGEDKEEGDNTTRTLFVSILIYLAEVEGLEHTEGLGAAGVHKQDVA